MLCKNIGVRLMWMNIRQRTMDAKELCVLNSSTRISCNYPEYKEDVAKFIFSESFLFHGQPVQVPDLTWIFPNSPVYSPAPTALCLALCMGANGSTIGSHSMRTLAR